MHFKFETSSTSGESMKISLLVKGEHLGFFFCRGKIGCTYTCNFINYQNKQNSQLFGLFSHSLGGKYSLLICQTRRQPQRPLLPSSNFAQNCFDTHLGP